MDSMGTKMCWSNPTGVKHHFFSLMSLSHHRNKAMGVFRPHMAIAQKKGYQFETWQICSFWVYDTISSIYHRCLRSENGEAWCLFFKSNVTTPKKCLKRFCFCQVTSVTSNIPTANIFFFYLIEKCTCKQQTCSFRWMKPNRHSKQYACSPKLGKSEISSHNRLRNLLASSNPVGKHNNRKV